MMTWKIPATAITLVGGLALAAVFASPASAEEPPRSGTQTQGTQRSTGQEGTTHGTGMHTQEGTKTGMTGQGKAEMTAVDRDLTDAEFAQRMHAINANQIAIARAVGANAQSKEVKEFARSMADDHTNEDRRLQDLARRMNVSLTAVDEPKTSEIYRGVTGRALEQRFLLDTQKSHDDAVLLLTTQAFTHPCSKELRDHAKRQIVSMNDHRRRAIDILEKLSERGGPSM